MSVPKVSSLPSCVMTAWMPTSGQGFSASHCPARPADASGGARTDTLSSPTSKLAWPLGLVSVNFSVVRVDVAVNVIVYVLQPALLLAGRSTFWTAIDVVPFNASTLILASKFPFAACQETPDLKVTV